MSQARFKPGDAVRYRGKKSKITEVWFDGEYYRYYVVSGGWTFSVPQWALKAINSRKVVEKAEQNQPPKNPKSSTIKKNSAQHRGVA